jgi:hypothetical protein
MRHSCVDQIMNIVNAACLSQLCLHVICLCFVLDIGFYVDNLLLSYAMMPVIRLDALSPDCLLCNS